MKILNETIYLSVDQFLRMLLSLLTVYWFTLKLGEELFGMFQYILSLVVIAKVFSGLGLRQIIVRAYSKNRKDLSLLKDAIKLQLISSVILVLLLAILIALKSDIKLLYILGILSLDLLFRSNEIIRSYYEANSGIKRLAKISILVSIFLMLLRYLAFISIESVWIIIFSYSLEAMTLFFVYCYDLQLRLSIRKASFNLNKSLLKQGYPLLITSGLLILYMRSDILFIEWFGSFEDIANYSIAVRISEVTFLLPSILNTIILPKLISGKLDMSKIKYVFRIQLFLSLIIIFIFVGFSEYFFDFIFEERFSRAQKVLSILIWNLIFVIMGTYTSMCLIESGREKLLVRRSIEGLIINSIMNLILIPRFGIYGAATATLASQIYVGLLYDFIRASLRGIAMEKVQLFFK